MKKIKNISYANGAQKTSLPNSNINKKYKFSIVLGDKKR